MRREILHNGAATLYYKAYNGEMQMDYSIFSAFRGFQLFAGFSGGADSTALLLLAKQGAEKYGFELTAIHFNHHLRGSESDKEAENAEIFAGQLGVKFRKIDLDIAPGSNLEARARQARLEKWKELCGGCEKAVVITGHHLDDDIENMFLRIGRGSNVSGLTGMELISTVDQVKFFRPLLIYSRDEIEEFLREQGIGAWAVDSSNLSCDYSRNVLRNKILPEIYRLFPGGKKAVKTTLENLKHDAVCLDAMARKLYEDSPERFRVDFWKKQERAMVVRMLRMLCEELFNYDLPLTQNAVERFEDMVIMDKSGICVLDGKRKLHLSGGKIFPCREVAANIRWEWKKEPVIRWGMWQFRVENIGRLPEDIRLFSACFHAGMLPEVLEIGVPSAGEKMIPFGRKNPVKIKELRIKRGVPSYPVSPVVRIPGGEAVFLPGICHSGACLVVPGEPGVMISVEKVKDFD